MLEGIKIRSLKRTADERGFFTEIMRRDWASEEIAQANFSISYPKVVRAWHHHLKGQVDHFVVLKGALKICAYDDETKELDEIVSTGKNLQVVRIPGHYWHGFKVIGNKQAYLTYFVNRLYDYENPDEGRRAWNDETIVPKIINGRTDDERCNRSWDWFYSVYK